MIVNKTPIKSVVSAAYYLSPPNPYQGEAVLLVQPHLTSFGDDKNPFAFDLGLDGCFVCKVSGFKVNSGWVGLLGLKKFLYKILAFVLCAVFILGVGVACKSDNTYIIRVGTIPGTGIVYTLRLMGKNSDNALDEMQELLLQVDNNINISKADTMLSRFNSSGIKTDFEIDYHTYHMVSKVKEYYTVTDGAFNPAVVKLMRLWGTDIEGLGNYDPLFSPPPIEKWPTIDEIDYAATNSNFDDISIKHVEDTDKYYMSKTNAEVGLDLGGVAKGYLAGEFGKIADKYESKSGSFDLSGDIYYYKKQISNGNFVDWKVRISNPRPQLFIGRRPPIAATSIDSQGIVTSGDYERFYYYDNDDEKGSVAVPHIINPKTNAPIGVVYDSQRGYFVQDPTVIASATVIGADPTVCEILSTAVSTMPLIEGKRLLDKLGYQGIIFSGDKKYTVTDGFVFLKDDDKYNAYQEYTKI